MSQPKVGPFFLMIPNFTMGVFMAIRRREFVTLPEVFVSLGLT